MALLGLNKLNSSMNNQINDLNLSSNISFDINNINSNNKILNKVNKEKDKDKGKENKDDINNNNTPVNLIKNSDILSTLNSSNILDINYINNININNNINNTELNNKNKLKVFHIDKIPLPQKKVKYSPKKVTKSNSKKDYHYLNFDFENTQDNLAFVGEYFEEIYLNLLLEEQQSKIKPNYGYMKDQSEINEIMRAILIDWLIDVHLRFNLRQETLFMAVWLIDTYLSYAFILREKLQLLGITCLLISCKSHEIYYPQQNKFIEMTDGAYSKEEMLKMENEILKKLNFYVVYPNTFDFYNILSKMFKFEKKHYYLGKYFIESALIDYQMIKYSSSVIAASCAYLVMKYYGIPGYQKLYNNFIVNDKNPEDAIKDTAKEIYIMVDNLSKSKLKAVKNKYGMEQFEKVSEIL